MSYLEEYKKLKSKIIYNKKKIEAYEPDFLDEIEDKIYGDISEHQKIKYEIENLEFESLKLTDEEKILYSKIMELILFKLNSSNINYSDIKKLIVAAEIFYNLEYGFYKSIKDINVDELILELEEKRVVK